MACSGGVPNSASSGAGSTPSSGNGGVTPDLLQQMLSSGGSGVGGAGGTTPPTSQSQAQQQGAPQQLVGTQLQQAEVLYQSQLEQLQTMGFHNRQANLNGKSPPIPVLVIRLGCTSGPSVYTIAQGCPCNQLTVL